MSGHVWKKWLTKLARVIDLVARLHRKRHHGAVVPPPPPRVGEPPTVEVRPVISPDGLPRVQLQLPGGVVQLAPDQAQDVANMLTAAADGAVLLALAHHIPEPS